MLAVGSHERRFQPLSFIQCLLNELGNFLAARNRIGNSLQHSVKRRSAHGILNLGAQRAIFFSLFLFVPALRWLAAKQSVGHPRAILNRSRFQLARGAIVIPVEDELPMADIPGCISTVDCAAKIRNGKSLEFVGS